MGIKLARKAAQILDDNKGEEVQILKVTEQIGITDFFVIATSQSKPHLKFLNRELDQEVRKELDREPAAQEGNVEQGWMLTDYGEVIIHLFSADQREFYDLEGLWADAERCELELE